MIGIITENLDFFLKHKVTNNNLCVFYDGYVPPFTIPDCPKFSKSSIFEFKGTVIATCIESTKTVLRTSMSRKKIYLVDSAEWIRYSDFSYSDLTQIFNTDELKIVCLNKKIYNQIENFFRKPDLLMEDVDFSLLGEL